MSPPLSSCKRHGIDMVILPQQTMERAPPEAEPAQRSEKAEDSAWTGHEGKALAPTFVEKPLAPEAGSPEGIRVDTGRAGTNPIRVEDHVSVDAGQLAEMAGFRNISTDRRYAPPPGSIGSRWKNPEVYPDCRVFALHK